MEYRVYYYDSGGHVTDETTFEAVDNSAAIVVAYDLAKLAKDRRTELWNQDRLVMRRSFPEAASVDEPTEL